MLRRMDVVKPAGTAGQVSHGLLGNVGTVVVQYDADDGLAGIVLVQAAQQCDELDAAMALLHVGNDLAGVQIERGNDGQRAMTDVLVIASGVLATT